MRIGGLNIWQDGAKAALSFGGERILNLNVDEVGQLATELAELQPKLIAYAEAEAMAELLS